MNIRKPGLLALHGLGYVIGAIAAGAVVGVIGRFVLMLFAAKPTVGFVFTAIGIVSVLYGLHELGFLRLPAPQSRRQVPQHWRHELRPSLMVFLYGLGLGPGFFTAIPATSFYVLVAAVLLQADVVYGALAFAVYGLGRIAPLIFIFWTSIRRGRVSNLARVVYCWRPLVHLCNGLTLASVGAGLIVCALTSTGFATNNSESLRSDQFNSKVNLVSVTKECFDEQHESF
jgi:hypothetical protein